MPVTPPRTPDSSRPYSGYEELDLEDEPLTPGPPSNKHEKPTSTVSPSTSLSSAHNPYVSPVSQKEDPWRSSMPSSSSASRFSTSTGVTSPPKLERASTGVSRTSVGPNGAAVLGVAVVDFNHLVSALSRNIARRLMARSARPSNTRIHLHYKRLYRMMRT